MTSAFTAAEVLTIIAALGVLVTGVGAVVVNVIVALRTGAKVDLNLAKTDTIISKVEQVHEGTNSNLSSVKAELALALAQISSMRDLVQDLKNERQAAALQTALATPAPDPNDRRKGRPTKVEVVNTPASPVPIHDATPDEDDA